MGSIASNAWRCHKQREQQMNRQHPWHNGEQLQETKLAKPHKMVAKTAGEMGQKKGITNLQSSLKNTKQAEKSVK